MYLAVLSFRTAMAAGNDDYQPVTKTVTFKIKVK